MKFSSSFLASLLCTCIAAAPIFAETVRKVGNNFICHYQNEDDVGLYTQYGSSARDWTQDEIAAMERVLLSWENSIVQTAVRSMTVGLYWIDFAAYDKEMSNVLGGAISTRIGYTQVADNAYQTFTMPEVVWREQINLENPTDYDITICFNSTAGIFYCGEDTSANIGLQYDLESVAMHEVGHTLGIQSYTTLIPDTSPGAIDKSGDVAFLTDADGSMYFTTYDSLLLDANGERAIDIAARNLAEEGVAAAVRTGATLNVKDSELTIYNPVSWEEGSSIAHFAQTDTLMQPSIGNNTFRREMTASEQQVMKSMGWEFRAEDAIPEPTSATLSLLGLAALVMRRRRAA